MEEYYNEKIRKKQVIKTIKNILVKLIYILLLPIILWDLIIIIQTIQKPNETPSVFGIKTFCIISGSMEPTISVNDIVIIKEVEQNEIKRGDIIAFKHKGETITHRVIKISKYENGELLYTTQGDANNTEDEDKITFDEIEGKCINVIPKIGKIVLALKSKTTLGIILAILIIIYIFEQKTNTKKIKRSKEREKYEKNSTQ